jgi:inorganic pyrophosphatase
VFWMSDDADHDVTILTVQANGLRWQQVLDIDDVAEHFRAGTGHFFEVYEALEPSKVTEVRGWQGHDEAHEVIGASRERFIPEWGDLE